MASPLLPDALWEQVDALLPKPKRRRLRYLGRKPLTARQALTGALLAPRTGLWWDDLPCKLGCGSGSRCPQHLKAWHRAGVWDRLHAAPRPGWTTPGHRLVSGGRRWVVCPGPGGAGRRPAGAPSIGAGRGPSTTPWLTPPRVPLGATPTAAYVPNVAALPDVVDAIPVVRGRGRRKGRPRTLDAGRASDRDSHRRRVLRRGIDPTFARRRTAHGSGLGTHGWMVERFFSWLHRYRRLRIRTDRDGRMQDAFLQLALCLICFGFL